MGNVHLTCLARWVELRSATSVDERLRCELCRERYKLQEQRSFSWDKCLRIGGVMWFSLLLDVLLVLMALSGVTMVTIQGVQFFSLQAVLPPGLIAIGTAVLLSALLLWYLLQHWEGKVAQSVLVVMPGPREDELEPL